MINIEKMTGIQKQVKSIINDLKKVEKLTQKELSQTFENSTKKQRDKVRTDKTWLLIDIDKKKHFLHCAIIEAGLANEFDDEYYGTKIHSDGWHDMPFDRYRPNN